MKIINTEYYRNNWDGQDRIYFRIVQREFCDHVVFNTHKNIAQYCKDDNYVFTGKLEEALNKLCGD